MRMSLPRADWKTEEVYPAFRQPAAGLKGDPAAMPSFRCFGRAIFEKLPSAIVALPQWPLIWPCCLVGFFAICMLAGHRARNPV